MWNLTSAQCELQCWSEKAKFVCLIVCFSKRCPLSGINLTIVNSIDCLMYFPYIFGILFSFCEKSKFVWPRMFKQVCLAMFLSRSLFYNFVCQSWTSLFDQVCLAKFVWPSLFGRVCFLFVCFSIFYPFFVTLNYCALQCTVVMIWCLIFDRFSIYSWSIVCLFVRRRTLFVFWFVLAKLYPLPSCFANYVWPSLFGKFISQVCLAKIVCFSKLYPFLVELNHCAL